MKNLNIIVPVHNEEKSISEFTSRLLGALRKEKFSWQLTFVNDHSTDMTVDEIKDAIKKVFKDEVFKKSRRRTKYGNVRFQTSEHSTIVWKLGPHGRATSILLGAEFSDAEFTATIDADLSYPPEAIVPMYKEALKKGMIIGKRVKLNTDRLKRLKIKLHRFWVDKFLLGLKKDTQSTLKVFRSEILEHLHPDHTGNWSIDIPLVKTALDLGLEVDEYEIDYTKRKHTRKPAVSIRQKSAEIPWNALKLKLAGHRIYQIHSTKKGTSVGAGIVHKGAKYVTHTHLPIEKSAIKVLEREQSLVILGVIGVTILGLIINPKGTAITTMAVLSAIYFADIIFSLYTLLKSLHFPPELDIAPEKIDALDEKELPVYSIMAPLYKEANVLPHFLESMDKMDWPKEKLDVMLLLEENDKETIGVAKSLDLPEYVRILIVPDSQPKTKPKACNYGLNFAKGEYVVIYDAEDKPDPQQLKKAYLGFKSLGPKYSCIQSKLNYYNTDQNLLTRLFTAEYSLWFDLILPGLQSIETAIPLGGTSNHFKTTDLRKINGWDPFNVTEDCDLGARLFKLGKKTAIINSVTYEEANSKVHNWLRQRSRWLKGYFQTYFVHMRNPVEFVRDFGIHAFIFQLIIGLRISFILINPLLWAMTIAYFTLYQYVGPQIESLFPPAVFYIAITSAVFGNFMYLYNYMIGAAKHGKWSVIKFVFLIPFYWFMTSWAAMIAFYQLIVKPHYWEKTIHGLNLKKEVDKELEKKEVRKLININFKWMGISKIKDFSSSNYFAGLFLMGATMLSNVLNFLYNAYLGRKLDLEDFGLIGLVGSFVYLTSVPLGALTASITHRSAYLLGKYSAPIKDFWKIMRKKVINVSLILAIIWLISTPLLVNLFKSETVIPFLIFVPFWVFGFAGAVDGGFLTGNQFFITVGIMNILYALLRLVFAVLFVKIGTHDLVYLAIPLSMLGSFLIGWIAAKQTKEKKVEVDADTLNRFPSKFLISSVANKLSTIAFLSLDIVVAKIFLSPVDAGKYTLVSLVGKMVYFVGGMFSQFIIPVISKHEGEGKDSTKPFTKLLFATTLTSLLGFIIFGVFGYYTAPILYGPKVVAVEKYLPMFALAMVFQTVASSIVTFNQSRNRHSFAYAGFIFSLIQIVVLLKHHVGIGDFVEVMFVGGFVYMTLSLILNKYYSEFETILRNIIDFFGLFGKYPQSEYKKNGHLRILILNWRDTKHVWAGGAEVYVHELAKRWATDGHKVTVFCGNDGNDPRNEVIDGVQIVRRGGFYTVYAWAFLYYILRFRNNFDVIIDSENGIPFFSPLYSKVPVIGLIHHVHSEIILKELKLPFFKLPAAYIAKVLESKIMPFVYKNSQMVAVSPSTKHDMEKIGFGKNGKIEIISPGVDLKTMRPGVKSKKPTVLYLGRLQPYKSIDTLIKAISKVKKNTPNVELNIAGFGTSRKHLEKLTKKLGLEKTVKFLGKVSDKERLKHMKSAWVFAYPSTMEGWGISIIEANACGTPVVASDVPGLRDSVSNPASGYLVPKKDVDAFAEKISYLLLNSSQRKKMEKEAVGWAKKFDWSLSAKSYIKLIFRILKKESEKYEK